MASQMTGKLSGSSKAAVVRHSTVLGERRTCDLRVYSRSSGCAGCSSVSRISVNGEAPSRWLSSLDTKRML